MIFLRERKFVLVRREWCEEAHIGLAKTIYDAEGERLLIEGVKAGRMILWRVNDHSWAVTEARGGMLFIWCYQGEGLTRFIKEFRIVAKSSGFQQLSFFTRHRAAIRMLKCFKPIALPTLVSGEVQYILDVSGAL